MSTSVPILCDTYSKEMGWTATPEAARGWFCVPCKYINDLFARVYDLENK